MNYAVNSDLAHAVSFSERPLSDKLRQIANFKNSLLVEFGHFPHRPFRICARMKARGASIAISRPPLQHSIPHVVELSAKEKVAGIAARRIVALVAEALTFGNFPIRESESDSMGETGPFVRTKANIKSSVAPWVLSGCPYPAPIRAGAVNIRPKAVLRFQVHRSDFGSSHIASLLRCVVSVCRMVIHPANASYWV
jgi:hypothetical protein